MERKDFALRGNKNYICQKYSAMVLILKKGADKNSIRKTMEKLARRNRRSGFNASAFYGKKITSHGTSMAIKASEERLKNFRDIDCI